MTSVFLSYAREDLAFVRRLHDALSQRGHSPAWDQDHAVVPVGSLYRDEIAKAIIEAEKFVFVISPDSLNSGPCREELAAALAGHKEIIPVVRRPADPVWPTLSELNWLFFDDDERFEAAVAELSERLVTDLDWVRLHAFVLNRRARWAEGGSDRGALLRGADLQAAQALLADADAHPETPPTDDQRKYIALSQRAAARFRRNVRLALAGGLAVAVALATFGLVQREHVTTVHTQQVAAKLAGTSGSLLGTNVAEAQLLAVEAYRLDPDPQTQAALFQAVAYSPALVRTLPAGGMVSALGTAADGRTVLAGTSDGKVVRWSLPGGSRTTIASLGAPVAAIASDAAGSVVAAVTTSHVSVWTASGGSRPITLPRAVSPGTDGISAVGVSPSGRYVAVGSGSTTFLYDRRTGTTRQAAAPANVYGVGMPSDSRLVVAAGGGPWQVFSLPALATVLGPTQLSTGVHQLIQVLSANGRFESFSNGGATIPIWDTSHAAGLGAAQDLTGLSHGSTPQALSISPDGKRVAVADNESLYVSETSRGTSAGAAQLTLAGAGRTTGVQFLGGDDRLVSATGSSLVLWDLDQPGRIGTRTQLEVPAGCNACSAPLTDISPDGKQAATLPGFMQDVYVHGVAPGSAQYSVPAGSIGSYYLLGWSRDSSEIFLTKDGTTFEAVRVGRGMPVAEAQAIPRSAYAVLAYSPASRRFIEIADNSGSVRIVPRSGTGSVLDVASPVPPGYTLLRSDVDPSSSYLAEESQNPQLHQDMRIIDLGTGHARQVGLADITDFGFSGGYLVIQRADRDVEVWNAAGTAMKYQVRLDPSVTIPRDPLVTGSMLVVAASDGTLAATQLGTGKFLGDMPAPVTLPDMKTGLSAGPADQLVAVTESSYLSSEGTLVRWDTSPGSWIRAACVTAGRSMTLADWQQYADGSAPGSLACPASS